MSINIQMPKGLIGQIGDGTFITGNNEGVEVEIGDSNSDRFEPHIKVIRPEWDCSVGMRSLERNGSLRPVGDKLEYTVGDKALTFYQKDRLFDPNMLYGTNQDPCGAFEFDIFLDRKPRSNHIDLVLESEGLEFHEQRNLTGEERSHGMGRSTHIIDSVAIYHPTKSNHIAGRTNYRSGKFGHIYRPLVKDSVGNFAWGSLRVIRNMGAEPVLRISMPEMFLANATYPILVDPTFGYTTLGGSTLDVSDKIHNSQETTTESGRATMQSMTVGVNAAIYDALCWCNVYDAHGEVNNWSLARGADTEEADVLTASGMHWLSMYTSESPAWQFLPREYISTTSVHKPNSKIHNLAWDTVSGYVCRHSATTYSSPTTWPTPAGGWTTTNNVRASRYLTYRIWKGDEMLNLKTAEKAVLGSFEIPAAISDVKLLFMNATTGAGADVGDDVTDDYATRTAEVQLVTCPLGNAITQADYFTFGVQAGHTVDLHGCGWFDISGDGTPPTGAAYVSSWGKYKVSVTAGMSQAQVSAAVVTALAAASSMITVVDNGGSVTMTNVSTGPAEDGDDYSAAGGSGTGSSTSSTTTQGADNTFCFESDDIDGLYTYDLDDLTSQPAADTELFWIMRAKSTSLASPLNKIIFGKKADDQADILVDTGTTLDTLIKDIPTTSELALRTLLAAEYTVVGDLGTVQSGDSYAIVNGDHGLVSIQDDVDEILIDTGSTLDALIKDVPTVAEFELRSLVAADYTVVADLGTVQTADHTAGIADIPTTAELALRTLLAAEYTVVGDLGTVQSGDSYAIVNGDHGLVSIQDDVDEILEDTGTTLDALIKDVPTVAEFDLRSLVAADYTIVADLGVVQTADHTAGIADIPTTAEIALRTLLAAEYTVVGDLGVVQTGDSFARIGALGVGLTAIPWNAAWDAEVQSEVQTVMETNKLDHLVAIADADDVVDDSIMAKLASKGGTADWSSFDNTTDALEAIADKLTGSLPQNHSSTAGSITTGTDDSGSHTDTATENTTYWQASPVTPAVGGFGLNMDLTFGAGAGRIADAVVVTGYLSAAAQRSVQVWAYDYTLAIYVQLSNSANDFNNAVSNRTFQYPLAVNMTKADGEVKIRFTSESVTVGDDWYLDYVNVTSVAQEAAGLTSDAIQQAVWARPDSGHDEDTLGYNLSKLFLAKGHVVSSTSPTQFVLDAGVAVDDAYNGMLMMVEDKTDDHYEIRRIVDWVGATREVFVDRAYGFTPVAADDCYLVGNAYSDVNATHIQNVQDEVAGIKARTDNLPDDPADQSLVETAISTTESNIRGADSDDLKDLSDQMDTAQSDLDNPAQYKADVSALAVEANVQGHAKDALDAYDPATHTELIAEIDDVQNDIAALKNISISDIFDEPVEAEGSITMREIMSIQLAKLAGVATGGGTTEITFKTPDGAATRIVMTVDTSGNRSAVVLTPTA